jgi:hypothetical protein
MEKNPTEKIRVPLSELEVCLDGNEDVHSVDADTSRFDVESFILTLDPSLSELLVFKSLGYSHKEIQIQMKLHNPTSVSRLLSKLKKKHQSFFE